MYSRCGAAETQSPANASEEKVIEVLQVDEKEIEEELEQIKRNAEAVNSMVTNARPPFVYDPMEDVPTLSHQTPLGENKFFKK